MWSRGSTGKKREAVWTTAFFFCWLLGWTNSARAFTIYLHLNLGKGVDKWGEMWYNNSVKRESNKSKMSSMPSASETMRQ